MKRIFVYITMMLLFSASAVFAGEGGGYGVQPSGPQLGSDPQAEGAKPAPDPQKSGGATSGGQEAGPSYRQEGPNNPVKSRWQIDIGGSVGVGVELR